MKKFLISAAVLAAASTPAFAGSWGGSGGSTPGAGTFSFVVAPIVSANTVNQTALALPLNTTTTTVMGLGGTTSYVTSTTNQTANAMNVFSSAISSSIGY